MVTDFITYTYNTADNSDTDAYPAISGELDVFLDQGFLICFQTIIVYSQRL